jgi:hypothetical protein
VFQVTRCHCCLAALKQMKQMFRPSPYRRSTLRCISLSLKSSIFWNITPCSPSKDNRRFGGSCSLHFQGRGINQTINQREADSNTQIMTINTNFSIIQRFDHTVQCDTYITCYTFRSVMTIFRRHKNMLRKLLLH